MSMRKNDELKLKAQCRKCGRPITGEKKLCGKCKPVGGAGGPPSNDPNSNQNSASGNQNDGMSQFELDYNNQHGVMRFTPKNPMVATQRGQFFSSENIEDWQFENLHITRAEKLDLISKVNSTMENAYKELADKYDLDFEPVKDAKGHITYKLTNPGGKELTSEQEENIRKNLPDVFNRFAAKLGGNIRLIMVPEPFTPKKEVEVANSLGKTPTLTPNNSGGKVENKEEEEQKRSSIRRPTPLPDPTRITR